MTTSPALSPELDTDIASALSELGVSIDEAKHHNDPLWMPLSALSAHVRVQQRLYADFVASMAKSIQEARQPVRDEELNRSVSQGLRAIRGDILQSMTWQAWAIGISALLIMFLTGAGVGVGIGAQLWRTPDFTCQDSRGGTVCFYWKSPPTEPVAAQPSSAPANKPTTAKGKG